ncbi:hypothetical protein IWC96_14485 [Brevundimonas sp. BAL450]|uniref:hypothetical protein n=1 Tax=Brevundimonas sp. BAL450 TaxID=1708162 RepID=UPI0018C93232|nr:hypothetical protein [Brevundimonas sp. BAL450]MBG7616482.1 hypothetical protein [Brevundimonas sp. BAL450]
MQTYRVFDCTHAANHPSDIVFYGPRWVAQMLVWVKDRGAGYWDYQSEASYQRHYERFQSLEG